MINVKKIELAQRTFTPYNIVITVSGETEHNQLVKEIREARSKSRSWWDTIRGDGCAIQYLLETIENHTK